MTKSKRVPVVKRAKPKGRGQPPFKPSKRNRKDVTLWTAGGVSEASIAAKLGISHPSLAKHFARELREGHDNALMANLSRLDQAAEGGNVTAMKHLDTKFGIVGAARRFRENVPPAAKELPEPKITALGKKEQASIDARHPDTSTPIGDLMARRAANTVN